MFSERQRIWLLIHHLRKIQRMKRKENLLIAMTYTCRCCCRLFESWREPGALRKLRKTSTRAVWELRKCSARAQQKLCESSAKAPEGRNKSSVRVRRKLKKNSTKALWELGESSVRAWRKLPKSSTEERALAELSLSSAKTLQDLAKIFVINLQKLHKS